MENKLLYEGKAKKIFATENPEELLVYYKDDATAGNGAKKGTIADKGILNNKISGHRNKSKQRQELKNTIKERFKDPSS